MSWAWLHSLKSMTEFTHTHAPRQTFLTSVSLKCLIVNKMIKWQYYDLFRLRGESSPIRKSINWNFRSCPVLVSPSWYSMNFYYILISNCPALMPRRSAFLFRLLNCWIFLLTFNVCLNTRGTKWDFIRVFLLIHCLAYV